MTSQKKRIIGLIIVLALLPTAFIALRSYIFHRAKSKLEAQLVLLHNSGYHVTYDSIYYDWKKNYLAIDQLLIKKEIRDSARCDQPEFVSAEHIRLQGFRVWRLLFQREIRLRSIQLVKPHLVLRKHSPWGIDSASRKKHEFSVAIDQIHFEDAHLEYLDSSDCQLITDFRTGISITGLKMEFSASKPLMVKVNEVAVDTSSLRLPLKQYTIALRGAKIDFPKGVLKTDSIRVIPHFPKNEFAQKHGSQIDRMEIAIPFIQAKGFSFRFPDTLDLKMQRVEVQLLASIYRDKRIPRKPQHVLLPVDQLRKLPFGLTIDTLKVVKSFIEYEEQPEKGKGSGKIVFDALDATLLHVGNRASRKDETVMHAHTLFMGKGELTVHTVFPWKSTNDCFLEGSLRNFRFAAANPALEPLANLRAEEGVMDALTFHFHYNDNRSKGEVKLHYHDLKLFALRDEEQMKKALEKDRNKNKDRKELKKDHLKTLLINAFFIPKKMDHDMPEEKRTGTIMFERDKTRAVFNYWWKSLQSGLKSAFGIDKVQAAKEKIAPKNGREERKAKREEKKEARKSGKR